MPAETSTKTPLLKDQLCFALYATSRAFTKVYAPLLKDMGVTYPQYLILLVLWEKGPQTIHKLAKELEIEGATATPLIKRMETLGLVTRERCKEDERRVLAKLTDLGESYREKSVGIPTDLGCAVNVSEAQAKKLLTELNAIRATLD